MDLEDLFDICRNTAIIPLESEELFNFVPTTQVEFATDINGNVHSRYSTEDRTIAGGEKLYLDVICVGLGYVKKYMYHLADVLISELDEITVSSDINHGRDISFFESDLQLKQFTFTAK